MTITKIQPATTVTFPNRLVLSGQMTSTYSYTTSYNAGENKIVYGEGPKYLRIDGGMQCNWKPCVHSRGFYISGLTADLKTEMISDNGAFWLQNYNWYGCPVALYSGYTLDATGRLLPPSSLVDDLMAEVYQDIAGRTNEYLLSLEDFAGLFSGKSLWKGIRGVAGAINGLAKATSDCRKLAKAFGWKSSLYNMWLSSKETVRQALGLRLGYRFSFKTTLNDIVKAVEFGHGFGQFAAQITKRNSSEFLRYSKTATVYADEDRRYYEGHDASRYFLRYSPNNSAKSYFSDARNESYFKATISRRGGRSAVAFAKARVRYPVDYLTMSHYYQGRFGLDKPLTTLWAIVPLSFVVDYLFNVQDALTYVDNKLSDYLVATNISSAWVSNKTFREGVLDIPGFTETHLHTPGGTNWLKTVTIPHIHTVYRWDEAFSRTSQSTSSVRAQLPPLIAADDKNWVRSVGTGLELLSQTRLR